MTQGLQLCSPIISKAIQELESEYDPGLGTWVESGQMNKEER
jgi:hypothetical protein